MMNFLNLEYFLTAAEELNFTKAAKKIVYFSTVIKFSYFKIGE
ncbi:hypothetical protein [Clostridium beijerinckii]|nr:hypothetical protein [Clostridium beijerinckii]